MKLKQYAIAGAILVLLVGFLIWRGQPEQVLKRRSKALIEMANQASSGVGIFDLNRLEGLIDQELKYQIDAVSEEGGSAYVAEVVSGYQWMGENVEKSEFEIQEFTSLQIEGDRALVKMQVQSVLEMKGIRMMDGVQFVEFTWSKNDRGDWRLSEMLWK